MLARINKFIQKTGKQTLALVASTSQTTCFLQLADEVERKPAMVGYRAPYRNAVEQTFRMEMHNLIEQEIH